MSGLRSLLRSGSRTSTTSDEKARVGNFSKTPSVAQDPRAQSEAGDDQSAYDTVSLYSSSPEKKSRAALLSHLDEQRALLDEKKAQLQAAMREEEELRAKHRELLANLESQSIGGETSEEEDSEEQFGFDTDTPVSGHLPTAAAAAAADSTPRKLQVRQNSLSSVSSASSRRMTEPHRPSTHSGRRTVTIARRTPDEALGFDLRSVALPVGSVRDGLDKDKLKEATFVDGLTTDSPAYRAGLRRGDQILEVDGENCEQAKQDQIVRLLSRNRGTVVLTVRTTVDFQRALQFDKYLNQMKLLKQKKEELNRVMTEERELTQYYSNFKFQRERRTRMGQGLDLCTAPVLTMPLLCEDLPLLVELMQAQWKAERRDGFAPERPPQPMSESDSEDGDEGPDLQVTVV